MFILISCEDQQGNEADGSILRNAFDNNIQTVGDYLEMAEGTYESACLVDSRFGFKKTVVEVQADSAMVTHRYVSASDCSIGSERDRTYTYYDLYADGMVFRRTEYTDMATGGSDVCGLGSLILGVPYGIDNIECNLSLEDKSVNISINNSGNYSMNEVEIIKI